MTLFNKLTVHTVVFSFLFLFVFPTKTFSQVKNNDSINYYKKYLDLFLHKELNPNPIVYQDTVIFYSLHFPIIFDGNHLNLSRSFMPECTLVENHDPIFNISKHRLFADANNRNAINRYAYNYLIKNNIKQIKYTTADFAEKAETIDAMLSNIFQFLFKIDYDLDKDNIAKPKRYHPKRKYWISNGNHKIQLSQNYISGNWYKGGVRNLNLLNRHDISFNYKKDKFQVNNLVEWRLNLYTNPNDTLRMYRIGEDLIRTYSNFGIQAFNNWYYSLFIEMKTQAFKNFKENIDSAVSSAFSPLYINIGLLGMRYQIEKSFPKVKGKKVNFNTEISPLSIEYKTVLNKNIDPRPFGIKEGSRHLTNFGSTVNAKLVYNLNRGVSFTSRLYYFTNYEKVTAEWENTINLPINRYFSTSLYLFFRYDDDPKLKKDKDLGYFQLNELLSVGFNYNW